MLRCFEFMPTISCFVLNCTLPLKDFIGSLTLNNGDSRVLTKFVISTVRKGLLNYQSSTNKNNPTIPVHAKAEPYQAQPDGSGSGQQAACYSLALPISMACTAACESDSPPNPVQ